jgi:CBS domain-containing protein
MSYYVKDYMEKEFPTLEVEATAVAAAKILDKEKKGYIIVLDKGKPYGIVTRHPSRVHFLTAQCSQTK